MDKLTVDFNKRTGKIKPMHCVNNAPAGSRNRGNFDMYSEIGFPYVRTHDAALSALYGPKVIDVHLIFNDFDADENDAESYDFAYTDKYIADTYRVGSKIFYRLGASIEHGIKKYGTFPPKDYLKWARICEHIIMHYNNKWGDGFEYGIEYWELWNEPDCINADGTNPCWQGTEEEFCDFFCVAAKYLKEKFPSLKIGGPAMTCTNAPFWDKFLTSLKDNGVELDFYSYHGYIHSPNAYFIGSPKAMEDMLEVHGLKRKELILNEWNYNAGWAGESFTYSVDTIKNHKGASFALAMMLGMQHTSLDMLMYYDGRISAYNGFCDSYTYRRLPTYYSFIMFSRLYKLGNEARTTTDDENIYICAAEGEKGKGIALTYFDNNDNAPDKTVSLEISSVRLGARAEIYLADKEKQMELVRVEYLSTEKSELIFNLKNFDRIYIDIIE